MIFGVIYDPIRRKKVADTPEERVRQALIDQMLRVLAFPKGLISVEKKIAEIQRRIDIAVFMKKNDCLIPLLLVECKADPLDEEAAYRQAVGYNATLGAPFWCLAHGGGIRTFWKDGNDVRSIAFLPPYPQLLRTIKC